MSQQDNYWKDKYYEVENQIKKEREKRDLFQTLFGWTVAIAVVLFVVFMLFVFSIETNLTGYVSFEQCIDGIQGFVSEVQD